MGHTAGPEPHTDERGGRTDHDRATSLVREGLLRRAVHGDGYAEAPVAARLRRPYLGRAAAVSVTLYVVVASCAFSVGGALMKASEGFQRLRPTVAVLALFALGAASMAQAMTRDQLSRAFIIGLGIEAVVSVAIGVTVLGERLSGVQFAGVALIVLGVGVLRV